MKDGCIRQFDSKRLDRAKLACEMAERSIWNPILETSEARRESALGILERVREDRHSRQGLRGVCLASDEKELMISIASSFAFHFMVCLYLSIGLACGR